MKLSARIKLTFLFSLIFSLLLVLSGTLIYFRLSHSLHKDFRSEMIHDGRIMAELFKEELKLNALKEFGEEIKEFGVDLQVLDDNRKPVVQSDGWNTLQIKLGDDVFSAAHKIPVFKELRIKNHPYALFSRPIHIPSHGDYSLHMVRSQEPLKKIPNRLLQWMLIIIPFMVVVAAWMGYLFAGRVLKAEERAFDRLKRFTADASHELRIPLTSLRGHLEVALRKERPPLEYKETIANALEEAEHLSQLTQDLLLLSQMDAGQLRLNIQNVPLKNFLEDVFAQIDALPDEKNIKKTLTSPPDETVRFDPERIRQLLLILMDNALKYGRPNGVMSLEARVNGNAVEFVVRDNGIGIPSAEKEKIFDRFYRIDKSRSREQGGTGLGLSIARWIIEAHHGRIRVESQEGQGSMFVVSLPLL